MTALETLPTHDDARTARSTESPALTLASQPNRPTPLEPNESAPRTLQARSYEGVSGSTFALLQPMDIASGAPSVTELLTELGGIKLEEHSQDLDLWRARSEFLSAVHAEQTADMAGVQERSADAAHLVRATAEHWSDINQTQVCRILQSVAGVAPEQLPLMAARAKIELGELHEAQIILQDRYGCAEAAEARQPGMMSRLACGQGRLTDAFRLASVALDEDAGSDSRTGFLNIEVRLVLAEVFFERNALDSSLAELQAALRWCCWSDTAPWTWTVQTYLARSSVAQQRAADAVPRLQDLRQVRASGALPRPVIKVLNDVELSCLLQLGDLEGARRIARSGRPEDFDVETLARVELCSGRPDRVIAQLSDSRPSSLAAHIRRLVLVACAEQQQGQTEKATASIRRAVDAARPEQYIRPFLEHATQIFPLLCDIGASPRDHYLSRLMNEVQANTSQPDVPVNPTVLEPLSQRERQVLQYLATHRTCRQIAKQMFVSANTVKSHQKSLYRKIGAHSRDQAVNIALCHGLI